MAAPASKARLRRCACGARLASDNDGQVCRPCERRQRLDAIDSATAQPTTAPPSAARPPSPAQSPLQSVALQQEMPDQDRWCAGRHAADPAPDADRIIWWVASAAEEESGRLIEETCANCPGITAVYALVSCGGGRLIRRTRCRNGRRVVEHTTLIRASIADRLWQQLLAGAAR